MVMLCAVSARGQQVVNVQFTDGAHGYLDGDSYSSTVSPLSYSGTTWNTEFGFGDFGATNLLYSGGLGSGINFELSGNPQGSDNDGGDPATFPLPLLGVTEFSYPGNDDIASGDLTLTISGLQPGQAYNVVLADGYNGGDGSAFTLGSTTAQVAGNNTVDYFSNGVDDAEFANVVPDSNDSLVITIAPNGDGQNFSNINGFQIEEAPEPGTWALMLGGVGLLGVAYRRRLMA